MLTDIPLIISQLASIPSGTRCPAQGPRLNLAPGMAKVQYVHFKLASPGARLTRGPGPAASCACCRLREAISRKTFFAWQHNRVTGNSPPPTNSLYIETYCDILIRRTIDCNGRSRSQQTNTYINDLLRLPLLR